MSAYGRPKNILLAQDLGKAAADSAYEVNVRTGAVRVLIQDAAMAPPAPDAPPPALGINGLHIRTELLYFTSSQLGTFSRVPLGGGAVEVLGPGAYDDFTFDREGRAWVTTNPGAMTLFTRLKNGTWEQEIADHLIVYPAHMGAFTQLYARTTAAGAELNGKYIAPWARLGIRNPLSQSEDVGKKLWAWLEEQVLLTS
ncbi:hypothetical protein B0H19DRAFT_1267492 [Mycena capillaripes]|nr:hypothetical protein B0H19DRAFT_1267492 [Mycena capillaripes]